MSDTLSPRDALLELSKRLRDVGDTPETVAVRDCCEICDGRPGAGQPELTAHADGCPIRVLLDLIRSTSHGGDRRKSADSRPATSRVGDVAARVHKPETPGERTAQLAGVVLDHTKQLKKLETVPFEESRLSLVRRLELLELAMGAPKDYAQADDDMAGSVFHRLASLEWARERLEKNGDGETLVDTDEIDDELDVLRRANLAASVAAENSGLDGAHIVSRSLNLILGLLGSTDVETGTLEEYNEAAGCVLSLLEIGELSKGARPEIHKAAVLAAHSIHDQLVDELEEFPV